MIPPYAEPSTCLASTEHQLTWRTPKNSSVVPYSPKFTPRLQLPPRHSKLLCPQQGSNEDIYPVQPYDPSKPFQFTGPDTESSDTVQLQDGGILPPLNEVAESLKGQIKGHQFHISSLNQDMQVMEVNFNDLMSSYNVLSEHYNKLICKIADVDADCAEIRKRVMELVEENMVRGDDGWKKGNFLQEVASHPKYMGYRPLSRRVQRRIHNLYKQLDSVKYRLSEVYKS
ncbi:hypothetical protein E0Z10_g5103 [Xylaria hypoxylon]|uniref:Uncharacterized protein n=1 Tax=Xylaria hypoxylon TaxID=37992 RepID=A0A4Z0Z254_9PEZI|nr:hypothetical protein E0Z10_g5103 [Xylaria hypoxylon]